MASNLSPTKRVSYVERSHDIVRMAREGTSFEEIGKHFGITRQRVHQVYSKALAAIPAMEVDLQRKATLERLDALRSKAHEVLNRNHLAVSQGRVVRTSPSGEPVLDDGPVLTAIRTLLAIEAEQSKLLGLYAPAQVEAKVLQVTQEDLALAELIREAQSRADLAQRQILDSVLVIDQESD